VSGEVSSLINWRWAFYVLSLPALAVAWVVWKFLPEPARGTQAWIRQGERDPGAASRPRDGTGTQESSPELSALQQRTMEADTQPRRDRVLTQDPTQRNIIWVIRYLLKLPTYRLLIAITGLIYYFFSGISMFGMIYFTGHYQLSRTYVSAFVFVLGAGAVIGVVSGGRISEQLFQKGKLSARLIVPSVALFQCVPFFAGGFWTGSIWLALPLLVIAAGSLGGAIAPVDAARLDIVHPRMWGRSESGRTALRSLFEGSAPLLFGAVSEWLGGGDEALMWTFILMLITLLLAGMFSLAARRTYPPDVATAAASVEKTAQA
jgi:predicted MFS family arabinose efflux permease